MRRSLTFRAFAAVTASAVAGLTMIAGCGEGSTRNCCDTSVAGAQPSTSIQALLTQSADRTLASKNAKVHVDFGSAPAGQNVSFNGDGVEDFAADKYQLILQVHGALEGFGPLEERVFGNDTYLKGPPVENLPAAKPWTKEHASDAGTDPQSQDPAQLLEALRNVTGTLSREGTARVRGVQTIHYRAVVDFATAEKVTGLSAAEADHMAQMFGLGPVPEDVYIDASGFIRRINITTNSPTLPSSLPGGQSLSTSSTTMTVDLYDFGTTNTSGITRPPASEVGSLPTGPSAGATG